MSRVEKNVEGNKISCFSINSFLNIFPVIKFTHKRQQQNFQSHCQLFGLKLFGPVMNHDNSKNYFYTLQGPIVRSLFSLNIGLNGG
jgi:hypothetical protein